MKSAKSFHDDYFGLAAREHSSAKPLLVDLCADVLPPAVHPLERACLVHSSIRTITARSSAGLLPKKVAVGTAHQLTFPNTLGALSLCRH